MVRESLSEQVADRLRGLIAQGLYLPGEDFLGEREAAEHYAVSRPVIREAYQLLSATGYLEIRKGRRARVLPPGSITLDSFFSRVLRPDDPSRRDLMAVREVLEVLCAREAASTRTARDVEQLRELVEAMGRAEKDAAAFSRLDIEFHVTLAAVSRNAFLEHLITSIRKNLLTVVTGLRRELPASRFDTVYRDHQDILRAVERGDPEEAERAMRRHFEIVWEGLRAEGAKS